MLFFPIKEYTKIKENNELLILDIKQALDFEKINKENEILKQNEKTKQCT